MSRGRGRYDRTLSRAERAAAQRQQLVDAAAALLAQDPCALTVSKIVHRAGTGRNTFYDHFQSLAAVSAAVRKQGTERASAFIARESRTSWTPIAQLRALSRAWLHFAASEPSLAAALMQFPADGAHTSSATDYLCEQLAPLLSRARHDGVISKPPDTIRLSAAARAMQSVTHARQRGSASASESETLMVDLVLRLFR